MAMDRRLFLSSTAKGLLLGYLVPNNLIPKAFSAEISDNKEKEYIIEHHFHVFIVNIAKCIGCGMCVKACKRENKVPEEYFRTWVERYIMYQNNGLDVESPSGEIYVDSPKGGIDGFYETPTHVQSTKAFFVPKLCNHCQDTPCAQVCPVGATYVAQNGAVLVDKEHCIGCGYCVQACPYGSRFINPVTKTADKCTWCFHRITKGLKPACVEVCPRGVRMFGNLKDEDDEVRKIIMGEAVSVLKPTLHTNPKCYYLGLDQEVI